MSSLEELPNNLKDMVKVKDATAKLDIRDEEIDKRDVELVEAKANLHHIPMGIMTVLLERPLILWLNKAHYWLLPCNYLITLINCRRYTSIGTAKSNLSLADCRHIKSSVFRPALCLSSC